MYTQLFCFFLQESGGLKQWKRKWFVLSDFCLYYYKGPEEKQTLGSVLLPSYTISVCGREDGINRKFAFKVKLYIQWNLYGGSTAMRDHLS